MVSALRSRRGASHALLSQVGTGRFDVAISVPLVLEYEDVLLRGCHVAGGKKTVSDILDYLCHVGKQQSIYYLWRPCLPDPKDDMVLELAVAAECDAIVTHNTRDFMQAEQFGIEILTPAGFLRQIGGVI